MGIKFNKGSFISNFFMDRVPDFAAVDQSVEIVKYKEKKQYPLLMQF